MRIVAEALAIYVGWRQVLDELHAVCLEVQFVEVLN